jgi:hypothetical protein
MSLSGSKNLTDLAKRMGDYPLSPVTIEWERTNPAEAQRLVEVYEEIAEGMREQALAAKDNAFIATSNKDGFLPPRAHRAAVMGALESMRLYDGVTGDKEESDRYIYWLGEFVLALRDKRGVPPDTFFRHLEEAAIKGETTEIGDWLIECFKAGKTVEEAENHIVDLIESSMGPGDGQSRTRGGYSPKGSASHER